MSVVTRWLSDVSGNMSMVACRWCLVDGIMSVAGIMSVVSYCCCCVLIGSKTCRSDMFVCVSMCHCCHVNLCLSCFVCVKLYQCHKAFLVLLDAVFTIKETHMVSDTRQQLI